MTKGASRNSIRLKHKAITTLFPYAVWRERDDQLELLGTLLHLYGAMVWRGQHEFLGLLPPHVAASNRRAFMWRRIEPIVATLLGEESPGSLKQAIILASPYLPWKDFASNIQLIQLWAVAASKVPYTNDIGQSVVNTLFRIANDPSPYLRIPVGMWSWLNEHPSLPPICLGRFYGFTRDVVRAVRALGDIEVLKSYLSLIWSEWDEPRWFDLGGVCASLREDFCGIGMGHHRQDLLRHLDDALERLDQDLESLHPKLDSHVLQRSKKRYGKLREALREVDRKAEVARIRELSGLVDLFGLLTTADMHRALLDFYVCTPYSMSIVVCIDRSSLLLPTPNPPSRP